MGLLVALALLAGDPGTARAVQTPPPQVPAPSWSDETTEAQIPAPTPPPATAPPVTSEVDSALPPPHVPSGPLDKSLRLTLELGAGVSPSSLGQLGAAIDFGWLPFRFVRLHLGLGSAWLPGTVQTFSASSVLISEGAVRLLFGADGVLPVSWGELFLGLESGATYSNASSQLHGVCYDCYGSYSPWEWQPSLRLRSGLDFTRARPVVIGFYVAYGLFTRSYYSELHWAELHGRIGFAF